MDGDFPIPAAIALGRGRTAPLTAHKHVGGGRGGQGKLVPRTDGSQQNFGTFKMPEVALGVTPSSHESFSLS